MFKKKSLRIQLRQGDVYLQQIDTLPPGAKEVPLEGGRIVLAHGEATGHMHAITDHIETHVPAIGPAAAEEMVDALMARCKAKAVLYEMGGDRFVVVKSPVNLVHDEHRIDQATFANYCGPKGETMIPPGIYELPIQVEHRDDTATKVED